MLLGAKFCSEMEAAEVTEELPSPDSLLGLILVREPTGVVLCRASILRSLGSLAALAMRDLSEPTVGLPLPGWKTSCNNSKS